MDPLYIAMLVVIGVGLVKILMGVHLVYQGSIQTPDERTSLPFIALVLLAEAFCIARWGCSRSGWWLFLLLMIGMGIFSAAVTLDGAEPRHCLHPAGQDRSR